MLTRSPASKDETRDEKADFIAAYQAEFESYRSAGLTEHANEVAVVLRSLGVAVDKAPTGVKERAVEEANLETAVPSDETPKRRGRPRKVESE